MAFEKGTTLLVFYQLSEISNINNANFQTYEIHKNWSFTRFLYEGQPQDGVAEKGEENNW